jgi:hypothetical protein
MVNKSNAANTKRASLTIEKLRSHAKIIQDSSFDATYPTGDDDKEDSMDPEMKALFEGEASSFMVGTRGYHNNYEIVEEPQRSASSTNNQERILTPITSGYTSLTQLQHASDLLRPHREFVRSDTGLESTKVSRVERCWLMIAESNRIDEVGEKIFFRYVGDKTVYR